MKCPLVQEGQVVYKQLTVIAASRGLKGAIWQPRPLQKKNLYIVARAPPPSQRAPSAQVRTWPSFMPGSTATLRVSTSLTNLTLGHSSHSCERQELYTAYMLP